jgi:deoxyribonucleoside regulator
MRRLDDDRFELLAEVASLYYEEGLTQQEISNRLQYSRSCISRMLTEAQKEGVVEIRIHHPYARNHSLETSLMEKFNLKAVRVAQSRDESYTSMLHRVGALAARLVSQHIHENIIVGLSWGAALTEMVGSFHPIHAPNAQIVQLIGTVNSVDPVTDGPGLVRRFASLLDGRSFTLAAPWLIENKVVRDALLEDRRMHESLELIDHVELAVVGIGTINPELSSIVRAGYITREQATHLSAMGIVGDVCGMQFDIHGNIIEIPLTGYVFGVNVQKLHAVPLVIGVAGGIEKAQAILGGLRTGLVTALVTDERAATAILNLINS